jgi:hypothetical protein
LIKDLKDDFQNIETKFDENVMSIIEKSKNLLAEYDLLKEDEVKELHFLHYTIA